MSFVNLELPPKQEELIRIEFSEAENVMYQQLLCVAPVNNPNPLDLPLLT